MSLALLLHCDGPNGSTAIKDVTGKTVIALGNAALSTADSRFGVSCLTFDGSGDALSVGGHPDFEVGSDNFTVDLWFKPTAFTASSALIATFWGFCPYLIYLTTGGELRFYSSSDGTSWNVASAVVIKAGVPLNRWQHVAVCRQSTSIRLFYNGTLITTVTTSATFPAPHGDVSIGSWGTAYYTGMIDEIRIVKSEALYTASFTLPTDPYNGSSDPLSGHNLIDLKADESRQDLKWLTNTACMVPFTGLNNATSAQDEKGRTVTFINGAKISSGSTLFGQNTLYLDGTDDEITIISSALAISGDYTIEFFVNRQAGSSYNTMFMLSDGTNRIEVRIGDAGYGDRIQGNIGAGSAGADVLDNAGNPWNRTSATNVWLHVAITRASGTNRLFVNGTEYGSVVNAFTITGTPTLRLGSLNGSTQRFGGYYSHLRITPGYARYTAGFTVPARSYRNAPLKDFCGNTLVYSGLASIDTSQSKTGGASLKLNGGFVQLSGSDGVELGSSDFTAEMWARFSTLPSANTGCALLAKYDATRGFLINNWNSAGQHVLSCYLSSDGSTNVGVAYNWSPVIDTWYHIAAVRSGVMLYLYVNGVQVASANIGSISVFDNTNNWTIGAYSLGANNFFLGHIDDLRLSKVARYTTDFSPPQASLASRYGATNFVDVILQCPMTSTTLHDGSGGDTNDIYSVVRLPMKGNNNDTTFLETNGKTVSRTNTPVISTAQSKFGISSAYFDGTSGTDLYLADSDDFHCSGAFTVSMWLYPTVQKQSTLIMQSPAGPGEQCPFRFVISPSFTLNVLGSSDNTNWLFTADLLGATALTLNTWHHVAFTDDGTTARVFLNGVLQASRATWSKTNKAATLRIGGGVTNETFAGYMDDFIFLNGKALWTAGFTPPTEPMALRRGKHGTLLGNASISSGQSKFGGTSLLLDGTGDALVFPRYSDFDLGSSDFTFEFWVRPAAIGTAAELIGVRESVAGYGPISIRLQADGSIWCGLSTNGSSWTTQLTSTTLLSANTWVHIAVQRVITVAELYISGTLEDSDSVVGALTSQKCVCIGGLVSGEASLNGNIDDVRVTRKARY